MSETIASSLYTQQRFLFLTLDPVHVGAGGYRLGRVDMAIAREPGTNLPKIPGTSLAGATRSYAAMRYGKLEAAGQHKGLSKKMTADEKKKCPILYTFGTATDVGGGQAGTVSIGDAHIVLFPVFSMAGPVWVSTKDLLDSVGFKIVGREAAHEKAATTLADHQPKQTEKTINLGWLLLGVQEGLTITLPTGLANKPEWMAIAQRIVLVTPKLFSQIVNSNLEVRTSVSIDPATGAAEKGALFTYEAVPRATWLSCDVVEDDYLGLNGARFPSTTNQCKKVEETYQENSGPSLGETWARPLDVVRAGLKLTEYLGVGGLGTRGFGRIRNVADWQVSP